MKSRWNDVIDVNTGQVKLSTDKTLRSLAIGSCVVVAAYDSQLKTGALAHIMLPNKAPDKATEKTKYAADAIDDMLQKLSEAGVKKENIEVCLVGGGNVLKKDDDTVCEENIKSTTRVLRENNLTIRASALGGTQRKSIFLEIGTGSVFYAKGDHAEQLLWKPEQ